MQAAVSIAIPSIAFLLLVAVGLDLTPADFRRVWRQPALVATGIVGPLVLLPVLSLALIRLFDAPAAVTAGMLLIAACPIGGISNAYSYLARASVALSVTLTGLSCLLAVVTIPALTMVYETALGRSLGFAAPADVLVLQLLVMLALPVALGMFVRARWPSVALEHRGFVQRAGFGSLALLVLLVIRDQFAGFRDALPATVPLAMVFVTGAFATGWVLGRGVAVDPHDRFTLAMEFATRNVAIATAIAVTILGRIELAVFATIYFLTELPLALVAVVVFRRRSRPVAV